MRFGNFVVVRHNGKIVCGQLGDCGIYLEYMGDANPIPVREVEPLFEIEAHQPFPEHFKVDNFRKFVLSTLTDADPVKGPHPAITHCDNCGCDWLDNGINPVSCPYCKPPARGECHCGTCTCDPNMTPTVRFDLSPAQQEGAIREHLIRLGWTPPNEG